MNAAARGWVTALMVVAGVLPIGISTRLLEDRPAVAFLLLLAGTAMLVMARAAWRRMGGSADPQGG